MPKPKKTRDKTRRKQDRGKHPKASKRKEFRTRNSKEFEGVVVTTPTNSKEFIGVDSSTPGNSKEFREGAAAPSRNSKEQVDISLVKPLVVTSDNVSSRIDAVFRGKETDKLNRLYADRQLLSERLEKAKADKADTDTIKSLRTRVARVNQTLLQHEYAYRRPPRLKFNQEYGYYVQTPQGNILDIPDNLAGEESPEDFQERLIREDKAANKPQQVPTTVNVYPGPIGATGVTSTNIDPTTGRPVTPRKSRTISFGGPSSQILNTIVQKAQEAADTQGRDANTPRDIGSGKSKSGSNLKGLPPLWDHEIDKYLQKLKSKSFIRTIASDEVLSLVPRLSLNKDRSFIVNTSARSEEGEHWIAVYISPKKSLSVEVYDPLAVEPDPKNSFGQKLLRDLKVLVDTISPAHMLRFKSNQIRMQSVTTNTCGYFCMQFIILRDQGEPFTTASGYETLKGVSSDKDGPYGSIQSNERKIRGFARKLKGKGRWGYI